MTSISDFAEQQPGEEASKTEWKGNDEAPKETPPTDAPTVNATTTSSIAPTAAPVTPSVSTPTPNPPTTDDVLANILPKIGDIGAVGNFKMMIIGPPGQTKSSFIATAPDNLIFDFEDGLISAKGSPHGVADGTQAIPYTNFEEFGVLVAGLMNKDERLSKYKVFSIDTLSDLHKRFLQEVTERDWRRQPSRNRYVPETEQYTEVNERILRVVRALRDLPMDILITSHSKTVEPKNAQSATYADFSESLSNKVMAQMDIVGYLQFKNIDNKMVPVLRTVTDGVIRCKSRIPLPAEIINPTYSDIRSAWEEAKGK
jgi:hypothetical protein